MAKLNKSSGAPNFCVERNAFTEQKANNGVTGLVVDRPDDVAAVENAVARLLADDDLRSTMATAGRSRAIEQFDHDRLAPLLGDAIEGA